MKRRLILIGVLVALVVVLVAVINTLRPFVLRPESADAPYQLVEVAAGFTRPLYLTHAGDSTDRLFVVEQDGYIRIIEQGAVLDTPFLDVSGLVNRNGSERGLLGLAFHPDYGENGFFFINYTDVNGDTVIARYSVSPDDANQAVLDSASAILRVDQPYPNHNAGQLAFGPDGYLYVGLGDGGSAGDPHGNGQNPAALLGKMLRIDVDGELPYTIPPDNPFVGEETFAPEVWAWGLRNPWRYSFDRETGDLYIADVGQNQWEEVNFQPAASAGGENYGWNAFEGNHRFSETLISGSVAMPVAEYSHADGCSITGGYVYRGTRLPDLQGTYIFGDWCSGITWTTRRDDGGNWQMQVLMNTGRLISSFGEDEDGEFYVVDYGGSVLRLEPRS